MSIARRGSPTAPVIAVEGAFDNDTAERLLSMVADVLPDTVLTLDFRDVRLFHDCAIKALAEALSGHRAVRFVGLSEHQYRLLRYVSHDGSLGPA